MHRGGIERTRRIADEAQQRQRNARGKGQIEFGRQRPQAEMGPGPMLPPIMLPLVPSIRPCIICCIVPMHVCMFCIIDRH